MDSKVPLQMNVPMFFPDGKTPCIKRHPGNDGRDQPQVVADCKEKITAKG